MLQRRSRSRSPSRTSHGFKLHVSNLPVSMPQKTIQDAFGQFGRVEDIRIIRKSGSGQLLKDSVYGFIVFQNEADGRRAMEQLNQQGWTVRLSKEAQEMQIKQQEAKVEELPQPSLFAFSHNAQAAHLMLTNNARNNATNQMDSQYVERLLAENHPNAFSVSGVPQIYSQFFLVREVWIGNISPATEKKALYDSFKAFGEIEGIEMFSSKGFAFIKFRRVTQATLAYERAQGILVDGRPVKVAFADPTRRIDIVGDSSAPRDPNFNPIDDENFKNLYLGYSSNIIVPSEQRIREVFSRYGLVKGVHVKQAQGAMRPYAFVDFDKGEQAATARRELYIEDRSGIRRRELGDPALEISFKNTNTIVSRNTNTRNPPRAQMKISREEIQEVTKRLMQKPPEINGNLGGGILSAPQNGDALLQPPPLLPAPQESALMMSYDTQIYDSNIGMLKTIPFDSNKYEPHFMSTQMPFYQQPFQFLAPNPMPVQQITPSVTPSYDTKPISSVIKSPPPVVKEPQDPNIGNVVWSGFMTRSRTHKVGVDATLVKGHADFLSTIYHLNITHRITFEEVKKYEILGVVTLENSVELDQKVFNNYIKYFILKQRGGFVPLKGISMYMLPPVAQAKEFYPDLGEEQLLGIFVDHAKRLQENV